MNISILFCNPNLTNLTKRIKFDQKKINDVEVMVKQLDHYQDQLSLIRILLVIKINYRINFVITDKINNKVTN